VEEYGKRSNKKQNKLLQRALFVNHSLAKVGQRRTKTATETGRAEEIVHAKSHNTTIKTISFITMTATSLHHPRKLMQREC
jgi:hypothetical protein